MYEQNCARSRRTARRPIEENRRVFAAVEKKIVEYWTLQRLRTFGAAAPKANICGAERLLFFFSIGRRRSARRRRLCRLNNRQLFVERATLLVYTNNDAERQKKKTETKIASARSLAIFFLVRLFTASS